MVTYVDITGYDEFVKYVENLGATDQVFFYFSGSKLPGGVSWCPDCVEEKISNLFQSRLKMPPRKSVKLKLAPQILELGSYDDFKQFIIDLPEKGPDVYFLFTGAKKENGRSWCIYCQLAEPVVKTYLGELNKNIIFAYVDVGDREYWKDRNCPFRTDNRTKLMVIPTIIKWKGVQRLEGSQCNKRDLLEMMFNDED